MLAFDCLHDLDYYTGKPYGLTAYHKKLVKTNESQYVITKTFNSIFGGKSYHGLLRSRWDPSWNQRYLTDTTSVISKFSGVKFRKSPSNTNYSRFIPGWHQEGGKFKLFFSVECFNRTDFHRENLRDGLSWGAETGCFLLRFE